MAAATVPCSRKMARDLQRRHGSHPIRSPAPAGVLCVRVRFPGAPCTRAPLPPCHCHPIPRTPPASPLRAQRSAAQPAFPALSSRHATAPDHQRLTSRPHQRPCPTRTRHAPFGPRVRVARGCHPTHSFPRSLYSCPLPASPPHPPTTHPPLYSPRHTPSPRFPPPLIPFHPRRLPAPRLGGEPREGDSG